MVKNSPQALKPGDSLRVGTGELVLGFAVSKLLARAVNELLISELSRDTWIDIILEDMNEFGPGIPTNIDERTRKVIGYARHNYFGVRATPDELHAGLTRMGY